MKYADGMYAVNPDLMNLLPRLGLDFLPYGHIDLAEWTYQPAATDWSRRPRS